MALAGAFADTGEDRDTAVLVGSFEAGDVVAALARLRMAPLLTGVRGQPPADVDSLARAAVAAASVLAGNATVAEFDLNPVMVGPAGHGCTAVDARVLTVRLPG